jgi:hypothetical protein
VALSNVTAADGVGFAAGVAVAGLASARPDPSVRATVAAPAARPVKQRVSVVPWFWRSMVEFMGLLLSGYL